LDLGIKATTYIEEGRNDLSSLLGSLRNNKKTVNYLRPFFSSSILQRTLR